MIGKYWYRSTILLVALGVIFAQPGWSDSPSSADPVYSEPFCLKIFEEVAEKARSGNWQISDRDRHILTHCRAKFPPTVDAQIPLPTAAECVLVVKTLVEGGLSKVKEIELPEEQVRSIERCDEVLKYYSMPSANMLPTLKPFDSFAKGSGKNRAYDMGGRYAFEYFAFAESGSYGHWRQLFGAFGGLGR